MELTPVPSCSVKESTTQEQIKLQLDQEAEIRQPTHCRSTRRVLLWLTLVILVATCCSALIPVIYGGPVDPVKFETASESQSLLSKDWPPMDVKQNLEGANQRENVRVQTKRREFHAASDFSGVKVLQKESSTNVRRRSETIRHGLTNRPPLASSSLLSTTTISPLTSSSTTTATTTMGTPTTTAAAVSEASSATTTTSVSLPTSTTLSSTAPSINSSLTSTTTTTTTTTTTATSITTRPRRRNSLATSRRTQAQNSKRAKSHHRNLIKLRSQCYPGFVSIGTNGVTSKALKDGDESEAYVRTISLGGTQKKETIVALRGVKSGRFLCVEKKEGFVSKKLNLGKETIPPECRFIEKHRRGIYVRYVSFQRPRRFLAFDEQGKPRPWKKSHHRIHSKNCTNFLLVPRKKGNSELNKIIREHMLNVYPSARGLPQQA